MESKKNRNKMETSLTIHLLVDRISESTQKSIRPNTSHLTLVVSNSCMLTPVYRVTVEQEFAS